MEKYKIIVDTTGKRIEFLCSLSENEAIDETTRYIDLILSNSSAVAYMRMDEAKKKTPEYWEQWFLGDGYYWTNESLPQLILSDHEIKKGVGCFCYEPLIDVFIEKEELI